STPSATPSSTPSATSSPMPSNTPTATVPPGMGVPRPILACVAPRSPAGYVAIFGYEMEGTESVHMPIGGENRFNRYREDLGQPTVFEPGTRRVAFAVIFDGVPLTWSLAGRQVTAWANFPVRCSSDAVVRIQPVLECTLPNGDGTTIARFGYQNRNAFSVAIPVRWHNFFVPAPLQRGQPVVFAPGRHRFIFEIGFSRGALVWFLDGRIAVATDAPVQACRFN
ncbi:MAG: FG-GAP repeat protein, partial [Roseiflexus sp.]